MHRAEIAVVGAGIGGLTAALAFARLGRRVTLLEGRTGFSEVGAGIQLSPNASRILLDLGLGPALHRLASEPGRVLVRSVTSGREIGSIALGRYMRERFGAPYYVIHRADLQTILLDAVRGRPEVRLLIGRRVDGAEQRGDGVTLTMETAGGSRETVDASIAIGADGVWSRLRRGLGIVDDPIYSGHVAWRAVVDRQAVPPSLNRAETGLWLGSAGHVVHYPIGGGRLVNIVAIRPSKNPTEGWGAPGRREDLLAGFSRAAPDLRALLRAAPEWLLWSLHDLPATRMAAGRIALIGDAAHPVLPFLAQGGALAIEDVACLAAALAEGGDVMEALADYEHQRLARVQRVQLAARRNGRIYHAGRLVSLARDLTIARAGPRGMAERYAWLYGWHEAGTATALAPP